jgi:putative ABC transport system ATP-binding protein
MFTLKKVTYKDILHIKELHIPAAQTTAIVGESGSGKSTLLKLLNHLASCDEGEITFNGKLIDEYDPVELRRQVIMLPQTPVLFAETVKEELHIGLQFSEKPSVADKALEQVLQVVRLNKSLEEKTGNLSGGERQRLALGRVLLVDPPVFLLDEPTSALDEGLEEVVMQQFFESIEGREKTVVMVSHSVNMARRFADQLIEMDPFTVKGERTHE